MRFAVVDYIIVAAYLLVTLAIGFWSAWRTRHASSRGFFVAEKTLPWWVVGFTMVAASISAEQMLGEVGYGFGAGLVVSNWDLAVYPSLLLMIFVFLPLYLRSGITTIPEYLERRYGRTTRLLFAAYTVLNNAGITLAMVLALGATAMKYFLGMDPVWAAAALAVFTGLYTVWGGMSSVAWTDTFQCVLLLAGGLVLFFIGMQHVDGGLGGLLERMPDAHLLRGVHDPYVPWPGLILLALSTNVWYCCTNQFYVQSCLGAKSQWHGRMGVLLTAFLGPVLTLCFAFPGYIAADLVRTGKLPAIEDANSTYPLLVKTFLGPGLRGFLVAAVLAAIMSTVSSVVNATASVFTIDIYQRWLRPGSDERRLKGVGRLTGMATLLVAFPLSLLALRYSYIFTYSQNSWCILAIPIMLVFTLGALWKRATGQAAVATMLAVLPFVIVPFVFGSTSDNYLDLPRIGRVHLFNFAFVLWLAAAAFMVFVSLLTRQPAVFPATGHRVSDYVWSPGVSRSPRDQEPAWYRRISLWAAVAGVIYLSLYVAYR